MTRPPSQWPFPAGPAHREAAPDPLDNARESLLDDMAERARKPRYCSECRQYGRHAEGCPDEDDAEDEE